MSKTRHYLTLKNKLDILKALDIGEKASDLTKKFKVCVSTISSIKKTEPQLSMRYLRDRVKPKH